MVIICWLAFTNAWADESASENVLDKGITFFGGIQFYRADGQFGYVKDEDPDIKLDLNDLDLDEKADTLVL